MQKIEEITFSILLLIILCHSFGSFIDQPVFMPARCFGVFIVKNGTLPFASEFITCYGEVGIPSDVPDHILHNPLHFHSLRLLEFEHIRNFVPDPTHVSSYPIQLVVELESEVFQTCSDILTLWNRNDGR